MRGIEGVITLLAYSDWLQLGGHMLLTLHQPMTANVVMTFVLQSRLYIPTLP